MQLFKCDSVKIKIIEEKNEPISYKKYLFIYLLQLLLFYTIVQHII